MSSDTDELSMELEMLRASYDAELEIFESQPVSLHFHATPNIAANEGLVFVTLDVCAVIPAGYPTEPAEFVLSKPRGLDDVQLAELQRQLRADAIEAAQYKEVHVFTALQTTAEFLTERNTPNPCPVCFDAVEIDATGGETMVDLKPCLHVMHASCYERYHAHLYEKRRQKESNLVLREGPTKAARLASEHWATCPVCRVDVDATSANAQLAKIKTAS